MSTETVLTDELIKTIFLASGFAIKDGADDLKACVYDAARTIEQAVLQSPEVQVWKRDAERMRGALQRIADMNSMSYHSLESAKITANAALENTEWPKERR